MQPIRRAEFSPTTHELTTRISLNDLTPQEETQLFRTLYKRFNVNSFINTDEDAERITDLINDALIAYEKS